LTVEWSGTLKQLFTTHKRLQTERFISTSHYSNGMVQLIGNSKKYVTKVQEGDLPRELYALKNSIPWPINISNTPFHLACYLRDRNYSLPTFPGHHRGIDIQTKAGECIVAPERSKVIACHPNADNELSNFSLLGENSKIQYDFIHVDPESVPKKIRDRTQVDPEQEDIFIETGEYVGCVGTWPLELSDLVDVPKDVMELFGKSFHHLHFELSYAPYDMHSMDYLQAIINDRSLINPLLLLKKID